MANFTIDLPSAYLLLGSRWDLFLMMWFGILLNIAAISIHGLVFLTITLNKSTFCNRFYFIVYCSSCSTLIGRTHATVFQLMRGLCIRLNPEFFYMSGLSCFFFTWASFIDDVFQGCLMLFFSIERLLIWYKPIRYCRYKLKSLVFSIITVLILLMGYIIVPNFYTHITRQDKIICLSYYAPLLDFYPKSLLGCILATRGSAVLINLISFVRTKFCAKPPIDHQEELQTSEIRKAAAKKTLKPFKDFIKIIIFIDLFVGLPYTVLREFSFLLIYNDFYYMSIWNISLMFEHLSAMIDPLVLIVKNTHIRRKVVSMLTRQ